MIYNTKKKEGGLFMKGRFLSLSKDELRKIDGGYRSMKNVRDVIVKVCKKIFD